MIIKNPGLANMIVEDVFAKLAEIEAEQDGGFRHKDCRKRPQKLLLILYLTLSSRLQMKTIRLLLVILVSFRRGIVLQERAEILLPEKQFRLRKKMLSPLPQISNSNVIWCY